ncbi:unnamed protein product [Mytilus coruscus]|uniref:CARD domain-containing protein n=1 Tax=Mytilus coruscus TaxID=42192 RepID=A0A6J8A860_MYTCO|nr:unnamed protein product [Mytilus coruscus]
MAQIALDNNILERKFTDNFTYLQENVSGIKEIVDILIEKRVINIHDKLKFLNDNKLQKEKIDDELQEVMTKKNFEEFIFALRKTGQFAVIETLTPNNKEFDEFIGSPEKVAVSSSTKTVIELKTELEQQAHKIVELESEKRKLQQDIDHLKDVQQGVRRTIEEKTSRIRMLKKENIEKKQLKKDVQQLQHDLNSSIEELKKKREYVEKLEKQYKDVVEFNKNLQEQSKEDRQQIKEDRKEREIDRKERAKERKQREINMEQMKKDREQREQDMKISVELSAKMDLMLSKFEQPNMNKDRHETSGTKQPTLDPRPNIAYNLRKNNNQKQQ